MDSNSPHTFHIPVMGLAYTIDTPVKVAHLGISSVVSIVEDHLMEKMREVHCKNEGLEYTAIDQNEDDSRAKRVTAYLNLLDKIVKKNNQRLKIQDFHAKSEIDKYFELLPDKSPLKAKYLDLPMLSNEARFISENELRNHVIAGTIDVNIMTKVDKANYDAEGNLLPAEFSDGLSALRGFAKSDLESSIVFSAGLNPKLYSYCEQFPDFFPDEKGQIKKKIILKVSDYRSAYIQGKFLAKKGLWVSEFRIESGLNCGGHAFATDGFLLGPILEEFKTKRESLSHELFVICSDALRLKGKNFNGAPKLRITAQGGIGTAHENQFLIDFYQLDATGWGSPFLLVPEATTVDEQTLQQLASAKREDYYLSHASPLGVPFNNFRPSSSEVQRKLRISKNRPGSPCYKKFLSFDTEFTEKPICTASREYQNHKIKQARDKFEDDEAYQFEVEKIIEKDCLCEGLGTAALLVNKTKLSHGLKAVSICPGPNLAFFSGVFSLKEMVDHIYGRTDILNALQRPHVFINELKLYIDYFLAEIKKQTKPIAIKKCTYFQHFRENLLDGIEYYKSIMPSMQLVKDLKTEMNRHLSEARNSLESIELSTELTATCS